MAVAGKDERALELRPGDPLGEEVSRHADVWGVPEGDVDALNALLKRNT